MELWRVEGETERIAREIRERQRGFRLMMKKRNRPPLLFRGRIGKKKRRPGAGRSSCLRDKGKGAGLRGRYRRYRPLAGFLTGLLSIIQTH
jgi:hypothetical protein